MSLLIKLVSGLVLILFLGWVSWNYLGVKPLSKDLSVIGQGSPAIVLVYESYAPAGMDSMDRLKGIRADFEPSIEFRVAHLGTPEGDRFSQAYGAEDGTVVLFDASGKAVARARAPLDMDQLTQAINSVNSPQLN